MRGLIAVVAAVAALWGGYWFVKAGQTEKKVTEWIADRRADGWEIQMQPLQIAGFPNRFDTTLTDISWRDPGSGWGWQAPFLQILALSYRPTHVILVWPTTQLVQTPQQDITISGDKMQASVALTPDDALTLERATAVFDGVQLRSDAGWTMGAGQIRLATRLAPGGNTQHIGAQLVDLTMPPDWDQGDGPMQVFLDATVQFDAPWDRRALEFERPQPVLFRLSRLSVIWGAMTLSLDGSVTIDGNGQATGEGTLKLSNWAGAAQLGLTPSGTFDVTLKDGLIRAGAVPLGPAPLFRIP